MWKRGEPQNDARSFTTKVLSICTYVWLFGMLNSTIYNGAIPISGDGNGYGAMYFSGWEHDQAGKLLDTHCHMHCCPIR